MRSQICSQLVKTWLEERGVCELKTVSCFYESSKLMLSLSMPGHPAKHPLPNLAGVNREPTKGFSTTPVSNEVVAEGWI